MKHHHRHHHVHRHVHHAQHGHHPSHLAERFLLEPDWPLREVVAFAHHTLFAVLGFVPVLGALLLVAGMGALVARLVQGRRLPRDGRVVRIGVPPEVQPQAALLLWSALHDLLRPRWVRLLTGQPHLSWEIAGSETGTTFRLWVPRRVPVALVERAVSSAWPGAGITTEQAGIEERGERTVRLVSELVLSGPDWFSLDAGMRPDPLPLILGQLADMGEREHGLVQVLARPATWHEQRRLRTAARCIRAGIPTSRVLRLIDFWRSSRVSTPPPRHDPTINPDVQDVMAKSARPLYRCLVRVMVQAPSRGLARERIHAILGGFAAYQGRVGLRRRRVFVLAGARLRERRLGHRAFLLSTEELAALAHLPCGEAIPGVLRAGARQVSPPPGLPVEGKPLGVGSNGRPVHLAVADARHHLHILGPTGVGKSTLIANLALADLQARRGAVVIDPKGDLVEDLLERIPAGREEDVDLLDPLDPSPPGLNVLDCTDHDLGTDQLVGIFRRVFERFWGPRTDDILRAALLTLMHAAPGSTLADVPALLTSRERQAELASQVEDSVLSPFWEWYGQLSDPVRAQITGPVLNKLRAFLLRGPVRAIVGQPTTTLEIPRALDEGRLLLAKLPKGTLGEDTSRLLGSFVFARVWQTVLARADQPPERRADAACYVDEVHNYLNLPTPFEDVLAEARAYRLSLGLAHQHLAQLPRELREALGANARTKVYFQLSRDDASHLERETRPELSAHDLSHLPRYTAAVKLCHDGEPTFAFTLTTQPLPAALPGQARAIRSAASRRGTPYTHVEEQLDHSTREPLKRRTRRGAHPRNPAGTGDAFPDAPGDAFGDAIKTASPTTPSDPRDRAESRLQSAARQGRRRGEDG